MSDMNETQAALVEELEAESDAANIATPPAADTSMKHLSRGSLYWRRFRRNKMAMVGLVMLALLTFFAIFGGLFSQHNFADTDFAALSEPPSPQHWFGTTSGGNDLYAQVVHGLRISLVIAISVSAATTLIAAFVGSFAAYIGGRGEKVILAVIHFLLIVPSFLLIALLVSSSGGDWKTLIVVLILFGWMYQARVIWSLAMSIREREFVMAARYMGVGAIPIVFRHIIPNIGSLLVVNFTLGVVSTVMSETGLSFLGLGVKLPNVSLGTLLGSGVNQVSSSAWLFYFPAAMLTLLTVSMAFISDGLRDALDPNSAAGGRA